MKKIIITLSFTFIFEIGCESVNEPNSYSQDYFPLKSGNKWYYSLSYPDTTSLDLVWEVNGQEKINGKLYFSVVQQNLKSNFTNIVFYRQNGDTLFFKTKNSNELIVADFSLNLNETAYWQKDLRVVQKTKDIIKYETPFGADYGYSMMFKKGIGIINSIQNGFIYYRTTLIKAEIK